MARELLGRPVARYSAVFVFGWKKVVEPCRDLLPKEPLESSWDVLWLGIQPFLCFTIESRKVVQGHLVEITQISAFQIVSGFHMLLVLQ